MSFSFADERFADIQMLRYRVDGFQLLTPPQRRLAYYLSEAALWGRDVLWQQNCRLNLPLRRALERIYVNWQGPRDSDDFRHLAVYLRRLWFANGAHHHYGCRKFTPLFSEAFLRGALADTRQSVDEELLRYVFDPDFLPMRVNQTAGDDLLLTSACDYYGPGVTQPMAEAFYAALRRADDSCPVMHGLNSRLELADDGQLTERVWRSGGMYGPHIDRITHYLTLAASEAETASQRQAIETLVDFYHTGDLHTFDRYTILWLQCTREDVDFVNGFTEVYGDPLGLKGSWEGYVNLRDHEASRRASLLSDNAQWFEDHSPVAPRFRKTVCRGVTAKVVEAVMLGGDLYPSSAIGINLPNSDWVRQRHGSKSVTIGNLTHAYAEAAKGSGLRREFVIDDDTRQLLDRYDSLCDDLHTDLHECLGHGSGQLLPGVDPDALRSYGSTIEEARADLFALYYLADPRLVELQLLPDPEAYRSQYYSYMMNGLLTQLARIEEGHSIEEAHMRNRALISRWCLAHGRAMELTQRGGKTYLLVNDYPGLRLLVARLLAEVQRIKSEGDLEAARDLVETYGVSVDASLHREVRQRYASLDLAPYKGFINPRLTPVLDQRGSLADVEISYGEAYDEQMLRYSRDYSL